MAYGGFSFNSRILLSSARKDACEMSFVNRYLLAQEKPRFFAVRPNLHGSAWAGKVNNRILII